MLITHRLDGSTLIELSGKQFQDIYRDADVREKVVMEDRRPAVRKVNDLGITYYTIVGMLWEVLKGLPRGQRKVQNKVMHCDACGSKMKVTHEYDGNGQGAGFWTFACDACKSREIWSKEIVGGTPGAGTKEPI